MPTGQCSRRHRGPGIRPALTPHGHSPCGLGEVTCLSQRLIFFTCKNGWLRARILRWAYAAHSPSSLEGRPVAVLVTVAILIEQWRLPGLVLNAWCVFSPVITTITQHNGKHYLFSKEVETREVNYFPQDHAACKKGSWNLNPVLLDPWVHALHWSPVLPEWLSRSPQLGPSLMENHNG